MKKIVRNVAIGTGIVLAASYIFKLVKTNQFQRKVLAEEQERNILLEEELERQKIKAKDLKEERKYHTIATYVKKDTDSEEE